MLAKKAVEILNFRVGFGNRLRFHGGCVGEKGLFLIAATLAEQRSGGVSSSSNRSLCFVWESLHRLFGAGWLGMGP